MSALLVALGAALVAVALVDVFLVVLYLGGGAGWIGPHVAEAVLGAVRRLARRLPGARARILSFSGPVVLVALAAGWGALVTLGCTLIVLPTLGHGVQAASGPTPTGFGAALYVAAMSLTTLGTGDLAPSTVPMRLFTVGAAALGFALLTLTTTYLLSVYDALLRRNTFASDMDHRTGGTGDAALYLARTSAGGDPSGLTPDAMQISQELVRLHESHRLYPVLHYFRYPEPRYALARVAYVVLDAHALATTALDEEAYPAVVRGGATRTMGRAALQVLTGIGETFLPSARTPAASDAPDPEEEDRWRERYRAARRTLAAEGLRLAPAEAGEDAYVELRSRWQPWVAAFAHRLDYDLDRILARASD